MSQKKKYAIQWKGNIILKGITSLLCVLTFMGIWKFANNILDKVKSKNNKTAVLPSAIRTKSSTEPLFIAVEQKRDTYDKLNVIGIIAIPLFIGIATIALTMQQNYTAQVQHDTDILIGSNQHISDQNIADAQHASDQKIAIEERSINASKSFEDDISNLLLHEGLRSAKNNSEVATIAKAKLVATLVLLNGRDKAVLVKFLYQTRLITGNTPIIDLNEADLSLAELQGMDLHTINFNGADLRDAHLEGANITHDQLSQTSSLANTHLPDGSLFPSSTWSVPDPLGSDKPRDKQCTIYRDNRCSA